VVGRHLLGGAVSGMPEPFVRLPARGTCHDWELPRLVFGALTVASVANLGTSARRWPGAFVGDVADPVQRAPRRWYPGPSQSPQIPEKLWSRTLLGLGGQGGASRRAVLGEAV